MTLEQAWLEADRVLVVGELPSWPERMKQGALHKQVSASEAARGLDWLEQTWNAGLKVAVVVGDDARGDAVSIRARAQHMADHRAQSSATLELRGSEFARNMLRNMRRMARDETPWATQVKPLIGRPAVLVGAGSSLDDNGHLLAKARDSGFAIIAVNTSCGAVTSTGGVEPDVTVCVEAKDVTSGLSRSSRSIHVLDVTAGAENWGCESAGRMAIVRADAALAEHAAAAGGRPIPYTGSCVAAAFSLAVYWGAGPLILVGEDLAYYRRDGRFYARGTPFEDMRGLAFNVAGEGEEPSPVIRTCGPGKPAYDQRPVIAEGWGGGHVVTTTMLWGFAEWFTRAAKSSGVRVLNATEAGVRIDDVEEMRFSDAIEMLPAHEPLRPEAFRASGSAIRLRESLASIGRSVHKVIVAYNAGETDVCDMAIAQTPILYSYLVPSYIRMARSGLSTGEQAAENRKAAYDGAIELWDAIMGKL